MASPKSLKTLNGKNYPVDSSSDSPFMTWPCICKEHQLEKLLVLPGDALVPSFRKRSTGLITVGDDPFSPSLGPKAFPSLVQALSEAEAIIIWVGGFNLLIQFGIHLLGMRTRTVEIQTQQETLEDWQQLLPRGKQCLTILPSNHWNFANPEHQYSDIIKTFSKLFTSIPPTFLDGHTGGVSQ